MFMSVCVYSDNTLLRERSNSQKNDSLSMISINTEAERATAPCNLQKTLKQAETNEENNVTNLTTHTYIHL